MSKSRFSVVAIAAAILAIAAVTLSVVWQSSGPTSIQATWMDRSADPGVDFNRFANGAWLDSTSIPTASSRWGTFNILQDNTNKALKEILVNLAQRKDLKPGSEEQKLADFWAAAMDEKQIEDAGSTALTPMLSRIDAIGKTTDLPSEVARLHLSGVNVFFGFGAGSDFEDSNRVIAQAGQAGLGLPNRDYYLNSDDKSAALRAKYTSLVQRMFELLGEAPADAEKHAAAVLRIETALAKNSLSRVEQRDPKNIFHITEVSKFSAQLPNFSVDVYLKQLGAPAFAQLNVEHPAFFDGLNQLLATTAQEDVNAYLRWQLVHATSSYLPAAFGNASFEFYGKTLQGSTTQQSRETRMVSVINGSLGEALGKLYVAKVFPPEAKVKVLALVDNVKAELKETLLHVSWMSEPTRVQALAKLNAFEAKIGYPNNWADYSALQVDRKSLVTNVLNANQFHSYKDLAKIGTKVDRAEWEMLPQTVNAYYSPTMNQIVFPAAILQAPFFDPNADDSVNYGGIGVVIGHEMTHAFDDEGSKFDHHGNIADWWTEADRKNFDDRIALIREQFSGFQVSGGLNVNGELVSGEAAADLGGVKLAYNALQKVLKDKRRIKDANGFTEDQRFFIAFAQVWAQKARPEAEQLLAKTDPHPPARFRVNGTLAHLPEFAKAFGLPAICPMVLPPNKRCQLW